MRRIGGFRAVPGGQVAGATVLPRTGFSSREGMSIAMEREAAEAEALKEAQANNQAYINRLKDLEWESISTKINKDRQQAYSGIMDVAQQMVKRADMEGREMTFEERSFIDDQVRKLKNREENAAAYMGLVDELKKDVSKNSNGIYNKEAALSRLITPPTVQLEDGTEVIDYGRMDEDYVSEILNSDPDIYDTNGVVSNFAEKIEEVAIQRVQSGGQYFDEISEKGKFLKQFTDPATGQPTFVNPETGQPEVFVTSETLAAAMKDTPMRLKIQQRQQELGGGTTPRQAMQSLVEDFTGYEREVDRQNTFSASMNRAQEQENIRSNVGAIVDTIRDAYGSAGLAPSPTREAMRMAGHLTGGKYAGGIVERASFDKDYGATPEGIPVMVLDVRTGTRTGRPVTKTYRIPLNEQSEGVISDIIYSKDADALKGVQDLDVPERGRGGWKDKFPVD